METREAGDPVSELRSRCREAVRSYFRELVAILGEPHVEVRLTHRADREFHVDLQGTEALRDADTQTLRSLGYLAEIAVRRRLGETVEVHLDINSRKERRAAELRRLAREWAMEALQRGQPLELAPMEAYERKAIHEALAEDPRVRTHSKGRGRNRRVVIEPFSSTPDGLAPGEDELPVRAAEVRPDDDQGHKQEDR